MTDQLGTWKTPGIWDDIPNGAQVRATRKGTTLEGAQVSVTRSIHNSYGKCLRLNVPALGTQILDSRDQWEVTYFEARKNFAEVFPTLPVGSIFRYKYADVKLPGLPGGIKTHRDRFLTQEMSGEYKIVNVESIEYLWRKQFEDSFEIVFDPRNN